MGSHVFRNGQFWNPAIESGSFQNVPELIRGTVWADWSTWQHDQRQGKIQARFNYWHTNAGNGFSTLGGYHAGTSWDREGFMWGARRYCGISCKRCRLVLSHKGIWTVLGTLLVQRAGTVWDADGHMQPLDGCTGRSKTLGIQESRSKKLVLYEWPAWKTFITFASRTSEGKGKTLTWFLTLGTQTIR